MVDQQVHRTAVERCPGRINEAARSGMARVWVKTHHRGQPVLDGIGGGGLSLQEHHFNQEEQQGQGNQSVPQRRPIIEDLHGGHEVLDLGRDRRRVIRCDQGLTPDLRVERGELALTAPD